MAKILKVEKHITSFTVKLTSVELVAIMKIVGDTSYAGRKKDNNCTHKESESIDKLYEVFSEAAAKDNLHF